MIQDELGIPCNCQRLRWGFPPKELHPSEDNTPLCLSHGERVSVEWVGRTVGGAKRLKEERPGANPRSLDCE